MFYLNFKSQDIDSQGIKLHLQLFSPEKLPQNFKTQILDFYRCLWPWGFRGPDQFRDWITGTADKPKHLVLSKGDILVGALTIVERSIEIGLCVKGYDFELVTGVTGVIIYPNFQGQGLGKIMVQEGLKLCQEKSQITLFHCEESQKGFYEKCGMTSISNLQVLEGPTTEPTETKGVMMALAKNQKLVSSLASSSESLYFGLYTW